MRQVLIKHPVVAGLLVLVLTVYTLHLFILSDHAEAKVDFDSSVPVSEDSGLEGAERKERTSIFFLKAHKCASSTVQNILMRFGLERGLSFVLPALNNYIGNPELFSPDMIDDTLASPSGRYHIFTHHSRYCRESALEVMLGDSAFVTILRHPADVYESIYSYYNFRKMFNITFGELLKNPEKVIKINRRYFNRLGFNQMSFDLGFNVNEYTSKPKISEFVKKIDSEFDLVMMSEWMEASLVLLADLMNWPLDNVVSLKLNSRPPDSVYIMSSSERKIVLSWNNADYILYTHFLNKFRKRIREYGEERMKEDIRRLLTLNAELHFRCVKSLNNKGFGHTQAYKLRDETDRLCYYAARSELAFTEDLRKIQSHTVKVIKKLDSLLSDSDKIA